jgi:hypothetical protein
MPSEPSLGGTINELEDLTGAEAVADVPALEDPTDADRSRVTPSRNEAVGMKKRFPVTAVLKSRMRS